MAGRSPRLLRVHVREEMERHADLGARVQRRVLEAAEDHRPELTLVVDRTLAPNSCRACARPAPWRSGSRTAPGCSGAKPGSRAPYDALFMTDAEVARRYRDLRGLNAHLMPEGCNPAWHRPPAGAAPGDAGPALLMLGSLYLSRSILLTRLIDAGVAVELRGGHVSRSVPSSPALAAARRAVSSTVSTRRARSGAPPVC